MADYSHVPLWKKLGVKPDTCLLVMNAPEGFETVLGPLPPGAEITSDPVQETDVLLLFAQWEADLGPFPGLAARLQPGGGLWVAWPKKTAALPTDLNFDLVQQTGLQTGLVDNKSCAIDANWTALRFVVRRKDRPARK